MIVKRQLIPPDHSFFLFGPRGTGKSTLLQDWQQQVLLKKYRETEILNIDLLDPRQEEDFSLNPARLKEIFESPSQSIKWCLIDEVQKVPALLDVVHWAIQRKKIKFALSGSSARKLKRGRGNLLAGRAFDLRLHPLTYRELGKDFDLHQNLRFGALPEIFSFSSEVDKVRYLEAYTRTYLREEIQLEQLTRNITKFRKFLNFAAQMNAKVISYSKLAQSAGIDEKSVSRYFEILEDTLVGLLLEPYDRSIRKRQVQKPKFYLFDTGVCCELREDFSGTLKSSSSLYGELFGQWVILECHRLRDYLELKDQFYFLRTKDDAEVDLIVEKRGQAPILIEIKSSTQISESHVSKLKKFKSTIKNSRTMILCNEGKARIVDGVEILPWKQALDELF